MSLLYLIGIEVDTRGNGTCLNFINMDYDCCEGCCDVLNATIALKIHHDQTKKVKFLMLDVLDFKPFLTQSIYL